MCPNHVDQELLTSKHSGIGRIHKVRRPKNARIVDTALRRGFQNNGIIEIENDPTDDEIETQEEGSSVVFRLSERGIKLDFIDRVKRYLYTSCSSIGQLLTTSISGKPHFEAATRSEPGHLGAWDRGVRAPNPTFTTAFQARSFAEQQAALNLAHFAQANPDLGLQCNQVQNLLAALIVSFSDSGLLLCVDKTYKETLQSEAPSAVVAMCGDGESKHSAGNEEPDLSVPPTPPTSDLQDLKVGAKETQHLLMLRELIRRRLEESDPTTMELEI